MQPCGTWMRSPGPRGRSSSMTPRATTCPARHGRGLHAIRRVAAGRPSSVIGRRESRGRKSSELARRFLLAWANPGSIRGASPCVTKDDPSPSWQATSSGRAPMNLLEGAQVFQGTIVRLLGPGTPPNGSADESGAPLALAAVPWRRRRRASAPRARRGWVGRPDSNLQPKRYERSALTGGYGPGRPAIAPRRGGVKRRFPRAATCASCELSIGCSFGPGRGS